MMYQLVGIVISVVLILVGVQKDIPMCLTAGVVFLICNIGAMIGVRLSKYKKKLLPILILVATILTLLAVLFLYVF